MSEIETKKNILLISNNCHVLQSSSKYFNEVGLSVYVYGNIPDDALEDTTTIVGNLRDVNIMNYILQQYKPHYIIYFINDAITPQAQEKKLGPYIEAMSNTLNFLQCLKNYTDPCSVLCASYSDEKKDAVSTTGTPNHEFNMQNMSYGDAMNMLETYLDIGTSCNILITSYKKSFFTSAYNSQISMNSLDYHNLNGDAPEEMDSFLIQCRTELENMDKLL